MAVQTGQAAPDFSLYDTDKKAVSLKDFRGKNVVLLFFPLAYTSVCTKELCGTRDNLSFYNDTNAQVFGISADSLYVLDKFKKDLNLNFPLLSDWNKTASADYNTLYEKWGFEMQGVPKRSAFVIDGSGIIRHMEILEDAGAEPDYNKIEETLKGLN